MRDGEALSLHPTGLMNSVSATVRDNLELRFPDGDMTDKDYLVELEHVCLGKLPERAGSPYLLQAKSEALSDAPEWYTTVTKVEHWLRYIDRATLDTLSEQASIPLPFRPMGGSFDPALIQILKTVKKGQFTPKFGSTLGYPLVWITPRDAFKRKLSAAANEAALARDRLGLVHQAANAHLVAMHIPASAIQPVASNRPTFADAGEHRRFLVSPTERPPPYPRAWGQTVDLEQLEDFFELASGGAERVCARIEGMNLTSHVLEFEYLGKLLTSRGVSAATDNAYAAHQVERDEVGFSQVVNQI